MKANASGRYFTPGLSKLVKEVTGHEPRQDEGYVFAVKNQNVVKILTRDYRNTNRVDIWRFTSPLLQKTGTTLPIAFSWGVLTPNKKRLK